MSSFTKNSINVNHKARHSFNLFISQITPTIEGSVSKQPTMCLALNPLEGMKLRHLYPSFSGA